MKNDGIIAFAFGQPASIRTNVVLASVASDALKEYCACGMYTQADIQFQSMQCIDTVTYIAEEDDAPPPPTLRIARGAVTWAIKNNITTLHIVCATPHAWRCMRDMREALTEVGYTCSLQLVPIPRTLNNDSTWFCAGNTQKHTSSRFAFMRRELVLRYFLLFFIYRRIAS